MKKDAKTKQKEQVQDKKTGFGDKKLKGPNRPST